MTGRIANRDEQMSSLDEQLFPNEIDEQRVATRWGLSTNQTNCSITFCHKIITFCPHLFFFLMEALLQPPTSFPNMEAAAGFAGLAKVPR